MALAYLARTGKLPRDRDQAAEAFTALYPDWAPGNGLHTGIWEWLTDNWDAVLSCPGHTIPD